MARYTLSLTAAALLAGVSYPALAQEVPGSAEAAGSVRPEALVNGGDIIVTAQRRGERLSRTPVTVTVVDSAVLQQRNITTESDLQSAVPGLQIRAGANSNEINFAIRGQSVDQFSGTRPGVLPYINEVQISSNSGGGGSATSLYDLQSIQVLKGPQGTLFGRNATGGAVLFTTGKPVEGFSGYAAARLGNYNQRQLEGAVNMGGETVLGRIAGFYGHQQGYQRNLFDGSRPGTLDRYGVRGSLTVKGVLFRNELVLDYYHAEGSNTQSVLYALDPNIGAFSALGGIDVVYSPFFDVIAGAPGAWAGYVASRNNPEVRLDGLGGFFGRQKARGPFKVATDSQNFYRAENAILTNATTFDVADNIQIKNVLGLARLEADISGDSDGSPFTIAGADPDLNRGRPGGFSVAKIFSEELQLLGNAVGGRLKYVTGVYFASEKNSLRRESTFLDLFGGAITTTSFTSSNKTYAAFGQATFDLNPADGDLGLAVTGGVRYTKEDIGITYRAEDSSIIANPTANPVQKKTAKNVSWTVGLQNQVDSNLLLYAVSRRSYRNGGFNGNQAPRPGGSEVLGNNYGTERATDVEGGVKYAGRLGSMPARINLAGYHLWIDRAQRNAFSFVNGVPSSLTVNVPKTKIYGFELDGQVNPASWLGVGAQLNYVHARFTNGNANVNGNPVAFTTVPDTPEWSGSVYADASIPISASIKGQLRSDVYFQKGTYFISTGRTNPTARLPGYATVDFRAGVLDEDAGWSLSANLKNAFDRTYYVGGIAIAELLGYNVALPGAPRTFMVEARFNF